MSLHEAVSAGDYRDALVALRDRLAKQIDDTDSARDVAALSKQLSETLEKLNNIPEKEGLSDADRIRAERASSRESNSTN